MQLAQKSSYILVFAGVLLLTLGIIWSSPASKQSSPPTYPKSSLTIETSTGTHKLDIELATSLAQRSYGLMHRKELAQDAGMLFVYDDTDIVTMWMKNTHLPLDMIFMDAQGTVKHIVENATPYSIDIISSQVPVVAVLEVNAGTAKRLGIKQGDKLHHPVFESAP